MIFPTDEFYEIVKNSFNEALRKMEKEQIMATSELKEIKEQPHVAPVESERTRDLDGKVFPPNFQKVLDTVGWERDKCFIASPVSDICESTTVDSAYPPSPSSYASSLGGITLPYSCGATFSGAPAFGGKSTKQIISGYNFANVHRDSPDIKVPTMAERIEIQHKTLMEVPLPIPILKNPGEIPFYTKMRVMDEGLAEDIKDLNGHHPWLGPAGFIEQKPISKPSLKERIQKRLLSFKQEKHQDEIDRLVVERLERRRIRNLGITLPTEENNIIQ